MVKTYRSTLNIIHSVNFSIRIASMGSRLHQLSWACGRSQRGVRGRSEMFLLNRDVSVSSLWAALDLIRSTIWGSFTGSGISTNFIPLREWIYLVFLLIYVTEYRRAPTNLVPPWCGKMKYHRFSSLITSPTLGFHYYGRYLVNYHRSIFFLFYFYSIQ